MGVGTLIAVGTLLSRVGDPVAFWHTIRDADWLLVVIAFLLAVFTDVVFGITFLGNVPVRIPIWPSIELQIGMAFSNLAVPVAADAAIQIRFLQKNGLDLASATATGGVLSSITEIGVQVALFFVALRLSPDSVDLGHIETGKIAAVLLIAAFVVGVVAAIVFSIRRIRQAVVEHLLRAARATWDAIKSPWRLALLVGGNVVAQLLSAASLLACVHAFGASVDLWTLIAVNIGIGTIASLVPIPGGGTAVSAIGRAGMLTAFGVPHATAAAAVLTHQIVSSYLLAIPGWFATNDLIRKKML
jgi:undecaprenyl-diphosphatase